MPGENRSISMILIITDAEDLADEHQTISAENLPPASLPIYQGSIVRIEQNLDKENLADLIIRIPNFQRQRSIEPTENQRKTTAYRLDPAEIKSRLAAQSQRLAAGLRNFSRILTKEPKTKRSFDFNRVPFIPDVEFLPENFHSVEEVKKNEPAKILRIKKHFRIKRKHSAPTTDETTAVNEQDVSSTYRYCSIPGVTTEQREIVTTTTTEEEESEDRPEPSKSPEIISIAKSDEKETSDGVQSDSETFSECYEITYEIEPQYQNISEYERNPPEIDLTNYETLASTSTPQLPVETTNEDSTSTEKIYTSTARVRFRSVEDIAPSTNESSSTQSKSNDDKSTGLIDEPLTMDEDYTVILQFMKHVLQMDTIISSSSSTEVTNI